MKKMWSEEEVNAAIAEYAATHPAGGKLCLHNVSFYDDKTIKTWYLKILSTEKSPFTAFEDIIGKMISIYGGAGAGTTVLAIAEDDTNSPTFWFIGDTSTIEKVVRPRVSNFTDVVTTM